MKTRILAVAIVFALLACACSSGPGNALKGFRDLPSGQVLKYTITITQHRTASGLGPRKDLPSGVHLHIEEEAIDKHRYAIVVRSVQASGEESQRIAAQRLTGRRLELDLRKGTLAGVAEAFSGTDDVAAADVGMLFAIFAPVLPNARVQPGDTWRASTPPVSVPWTTSPLSFTVDHRVTKRDTVRQLDAAHVASDALSNVRFRLPLVVPQRSAQGGGGSTELIVNKLFDQLFSDIDDPVEGIAATIAAIPLAIAAPFLAIGEAIGNMFGGGSSKPKEPKLPVVDLAGPIELKSDTTVWTTDGRVLGATGSGTMALAGSIPQLEGEAAKLTGKTLHLDTRWTFVRTMTSPWPAPRNEPGRGALPFVALAIVVLALAGVITASRRRPKKRVAVVPRERDKLTASV